MDMFFKKKIIVFIGVLVLLLIIAGFSYSNLGIGYNDCRVDSTNRDGCVGNRTSSGVNFDLINIPAEIDDNSGYTVENATGNNYFIPTGSKAEFESFKNFAYNTSGLDLTPIASGCAASTISDGSGSCAISSGNNGDSRNCSYTGSSIWGGGVQVSTRNCSNSSTGSARSGACSPGQTHNYNVSWPNSATDSCSDYWAYGYTRVYQQSCVAGSSITISATCNDGSWVVQGEN